jgi:hypothetical protein
MAPLLQLSAGLLHTRQSIPPLQFHPHGKDQPRHRRFVLELHPPGHPLEQLKLIQAAFRGEVLLQHDPSPFRCTDSKEYAQG